MPPFMVQLAGIFGATLNLSCGRVTVIPSGDPERIRTGVRSVSVSGVRGRIRTEKATVHNPVDQLVGRSEAPQLYPGDDPVGQQPLRDAHSHGYKPGAF
jgi:hypothetical protein